VAEWLKTDSEISETGIRDRLSEAALAQYASKEAQVGPELMRQFERSLMLQTLDQHWRDHLANLDHLRQGIHLRGYAQKNPKQEYKRESFELFSDMLDRVKQDVVKIVLTVQVRTPEDVQAVEEAPAVTNVRYQHADYDAALASEPETATRPRRWPRLRSSGQGRKWDATIRVPADRAGNTSSATVGWRK
jgi:preprotein translocase subunit SecA